MLIREEQYFLLACKTPFQYFLGIAGRADNALVPSAESFQIGSGVNISDGRDGFIRVKHLGQFFPAAFDSG